MNCLATDAEEKPQAFANVDDILMKSFCKWSRSISLLLPTIQLRVMHFAESSDVFFASTSPRISA
jgi:hypothetical protein